MDQKELKKAVLSGKIFVYPTDTVYGLGCNALDEKAVSKIKAIKKRDKSKPLSVIAPSINWIKENCIVNVDLNKYLPGPYTVVLKKKNRHFLSWLSDEALGIRIPDSEFTRGIQKVGVPFVTTSANLSGEKPADSIGEIPKEILSKADIVVDGGKLAGKPSALVIGGKEIVR